VIGAVPQSVRSLHCCCGRGRPGRQGVQAATFGHRTVSETSASPPGQRRQLDRQRRRTRQIRLLAKRAFRPKLDVAVFQQSPDDVGAVWIPAIEDLWTDQMIASSLTLSFRRGRNYAV
jgi:hypothetical protein